MVAVQAKSRLTSKTQGPSVYIHCWFSDSQISGKQKTKTESNVYISLTEAWQLRIIAYQDAGQVPFESYWFKRKLVAQTGGASSVSSFTVGCPFVYVCSVLPDVVLKRIWRTVHA